MSPELNLLKNLKSRIESVTSYSKDKSDSFGEVFTPLTLVREMVDKLPEELFEDPTKTFFDPAVGKGQFPWYIVCKLMMSEGMKKFEPNVKSRYIHILENQIYMAEYQRTSAEELNNIFNPGASIKLNLYIGDTLTMPEDFFNLTWGERREKYKDNCI